MALLCTTKANINFIQCWYVVKYVKFRFSKKVINFETIPLKRVKFTKGAGAGAKCDHQRIGVRTRVRANLDLDVRGACVRRKKRSQPMPCKSASVYLSFLLK